MPKASSTSKSEPPALEPAANTTTALVPLARLHPAPWNPRLRNDERFGNLQASIRSDPTFLLKRPVLADASGEIYGGNVRFLAFSALVESGWLPPWGTATIPADVDDVDPALAKQRALRDNNQWGDWDYDVLPELLDELRAAGADLDVLGFGTAQLDSLLASIGAGAPTLEELSDLYGDVTEPFHDGFVTWKIRLHPETIARLKDGLKQQAGETDNARMVALLDLALPPEVAEDQEDADDTGGDDEQEADEDQGADDEPEPSSTPEVLEPVVA